MTAIRTGFSMSPEYQKALAKLNREERQVLGSLLLDNNAADLEMKKYLTFIDLGNRQKATERELALRETEMGQKYALGQEQLASQVGLRERELEQGLRLGRERMATSDEISRSQIAARSAIPMAEMEFEKSQYPWSLGIGLANVGAGGALGYGKMKSGEQDAATLRKIALNYGQGG